MGRTMAQSDEVFGSEILPLMDAVALDGSWRETRWTTTQVLGKCKMVRLMGSCQGQNLFRRASIHPTIESRCHVTWHAVESSQWPLG